MMIFLSVFFISVKVCCSLRRSGKQKSFVQVSFASRFSFRNQHKQVGEL
jgi:hypothetical protein